MAITTTRGLCPVATWVRMYDDDGRPRLTQIWTVPDPVASFALMAPRAVR